MTTHEETLVIEAAEAWHEQEQCSIPMPRREDARFALHTAVRALRASRAATAASECNNSKEVQPCAVEPDAVASGKSAIETTGDVGPLADRSSASLRGAYVPKVGDRVREKDRPSKTGTVDDVQNGGLVWVEGDDGVSRGMLPEDLDPLPPPAQPVAKGTP